MSIRCWLALAALSFFMVPQLHAAEGAVIDSMDAINFPLPKEKAKVEVVDGKVGKAIKFTFDNDCRNVYAMMKTRGAAEWDSAAGFSFWVKGDGSEHCGGIQFIWNEDYALRYDCCFPISGTDWQKVTVPWRDLLPVLAKEGKPIDAKTGCAPSKLGQIWVGKWWYWKDYAAHSFCIDEIRLEPTIDFDTKDYKPAGAPLERVLAKLKAGKPVTIVTMGDSLTDYAHWANKETNWPTLLKKAIEEKYKSQVTIENPAIGGTELRQNLILIPRWIQKAPEPDLVTVCFGGNDWNSGMRGPLFLEVVKEGIDRIRRATKGKSDVLFLTTCPGATAWDTYAELAEAVRTGSKDRNAGLADIYKAIQEAGKDNKELPFATDKTHLGKPGHEVFAKTVLAAIEAGGK